MDRTLASEAGNARSIRAENTRKTGLRPVFNFCLKGLTDERNYVSIFFTQNQQKLEGGTVKRLLMMLTVLFALGAVPAVAQTPPPGAGRSILLPPNAPTTSPACPTCTEQGRTGVLEVGRRWEVRRSDSARKAYRATFGRTVFNDPTRPGALVPTARCSTCGNLHQMPGVKEFKKALSGDQLREQQRVAADRAAEAGVGRDGPASQGGRVQAADPQRNAFRQRVAATRDPAPPRLLLAPPPGGGGGQGGSSSGLLGGGPSAGSGNNQGNDGTSQRRALVAYPGCLGDFGGPGRRSCTGAEALSRAAAPLTVGAAVVGSLATGGTAPAGALLLRAAGQRAVQAGAVLAPALAGR